jgi:hypothetical protein
MTHAEDLERRYRRWLKCYPIAFRREHEAELLGVLLAGAREGQRRPEPMECLDLVRNGLRMRLCPTSPRSDPSAAKAVQLMYAGAVVELVTAGVVLTTFADVRSSLVARNPGYTEVQWHAVVAGQLEPLAVAAGIAVAVWLLMAWTNGRGYRWARFVFALFFAVNMFGLISGLAQGSAVYARVDLVFGIILCLVQLAAVVLVFHKELRKISGPRSGARRTGDHRPG